MQLFCHRSIWDLNPNKFYMVNWQLDIEIRIPQLNFCIKLRPMMIKLLHNNDNLGAQGGISHAVFDPGGLM